MRSSLWCSISNFLWTKDALLMPLDVICSSDTSLNTCVDSSCLSLCLCRAPLYFKAFLAQLGILIGSVLWWSSSQTHSCHTAQPNNFQTELFRKKSEKKIMRTIEEVLYFFKRDIFHLQRKILSTKENLLQYFHPNFKNLYNHAVGKRRPVSRGICGKAGEA